MSQEELVSYYERAKSGSGRKAGSGATSRASRRAFRTGNTVLFLSVIAVLIDISNACLNFTTGGQLDSCAVDKTVETILIGLGTETCVQLRTQSGKQ